MRKMTDSLVLMLTPDFPPARGGIQMIMYRLATHAPRLRLYVVTPDAPGAQAFDREQPFTIRRTRGTLFHQSTIVALNAQSVVEGLRTRPSVVLSGHIVTSPAAAVLRRALRIPVVQYVYADEMRARPALARFAIRSANVTIALSRYARDLAQALGAGSSRVRRIPPGVDLPDRPGAGRPETPTFVTVGRLHQRYKGHDVLMRAMPLILARVPEARWIVVGEGPLRRPLEDLAASLGITPHVHFAGSTSYAKDAMWFDRAHVFAMPSRLAAGGAGGEGYGIVFMEASAHGLPVVAGNVAGAKDAVVDGVTGELVDPTDHVGVAEAVSGLLLDPERAERLGQAGRARAEQFGWPRIARKVERVLLAEAAASR